MNDILISNNVKITDPVINDLKDKCQEIIMASINQRISGELNPSTFLLRDTNLIDTKFKSKPFTSDLVVRHIKNSTTDSNLAFRTFRPAQVLTTSEVYRVALNSKINLIMNENLLKTRFQTSQIKKITKAYAIKFIEQLTSVVVTPPIGPNIPLNKGIEFQVKEVKCIDETNPERFGNDEIAIGGVFTDPIGNTSMFNELRVGNNFDDGDVKVYNPDLLMKSFAIPNASYPHFYTAVIPLAEKDNGGLSNFIQELYESIKDDVQAILTILGAAAGAWIGGQIGGAIGSIGGPLGTIIGVVAGAILGAIIAAIGNALRDDVFQPQMALITIPSSTASFNGSLNSPYQFLNFHGFGGQYRVKYRWVIKR